MTSSWFFLSTLPYVLFCLHFHLGGSLPESTFRAVMESDILVHVCSIRFVTRKYIIYLRFNNAVSISAHVTLNDTAISEL